jgi:hypothetical protein
MVPPIKYWFNDITRWIIKDIVEVFVLDSGSLFEVQPYDYHDIEHEKDGWNDAKFQWIGQIIHLVAIIIMNKYQFFSSEWVHYLFWFPLFSSVQFQYRLFPLTLWTELVFYISAEYWLVSLLIFWATSILIQLTAFGSTCDAGLHVDILPAIIPCSRYSPVSFYFLNRARVWLSGSSLF